MKKEELIVLGLAGIAVYMILKSGGVSQAMGRVINADFLRETGQRYNTNPASQQTRMLAEQDAWFY
jgi:hypothetical protein